MSIFDFHIKRGNRHPKLEAVLRYGNGNLVDLTGATVKFLFRKPDKTAVAGNVVIVGPPVDAAVEYEWGANDTDVKGLMFGEFEVTFGDGKKITIPNFRHLHLLVYESLG